MTILDSGTDQDLVRLWTLISDLSEQVSQNRNLSVTLYGQVGSVKSQATHAQTGFVLRRYNLDKSQEAYDAELERMNAAMSAENHSLQYDSKQLHGLIREYEQTLETLMTTFRNRARDVQERELSLIREYESKLLSREEENATQDLATSTAVSESLARISHFLRQFLRTLGGEDVSPQQQTGDDERGGDAWTDAAAAHLALERECELARLERENEELRRMVDVVGYDGRSAAGARPALDAEYPISPARRPLPLGGGPPRAVGPFGTYKRRLAV